MDGLFIFGLLMIAMAGICAILSPRAMWYWNVGCKFRDAQPSDAALAMTRLGGVLMVVMAIILLVNSVV